MGQHHHNHHQGHNHGSASERMGWAFFLNFGFTIIEFIGGWLTNSTAIMADAVHDLGDSISIGSAWLLGRLSDKQADQTYTYGYKRLSLFGALINSVVLVVGSVWVLTVAIPRLFAPVMPHTEGMFLLAILGVAVNGYAAYRLSGGKTLNEKVLNWHLIEDVLGWVAVLIVSVVMHFVDWPILDPLLSVGFTLFILFNVLRNLKTTAQLFFQATPDKDMLAAIKQKLMTVSGVAGIHHLHLWSLDGEHHVLSTHISTEASFPISSYAVLKTDLNQALNEFDLSHTTLEIELSDEQCRNG